MDRTAQWIDDVSRITTNAQLAGCSARPHVGANSPFSVSPRHPKLSIRDLIPDGSESSSSLKGPEFDPADEVDLAAASLDPGPDNLDDPWPYTFRVSRRHSIRPWRGMGADRLFF